MTVVTSTSGHPVACGLIVTQTFMCCCLRGIEPTHYEIHLAVDDRETTPELVLLTRDLRLYRQALDAEGTGQRLDVEWKPAKRQDGRSCQQLVALWRSV